MNEQNEILRAADNPFGLVYEGAIRTNVPGSVSIRPTGYSHLGIRIAANVYLPADYDGTRHLPAVAVAHPNGGVKEQVAGLMAQRLAALGFVAVAADAACQGASGGLPRHDDRPWRRTEDVRGMVDFLSRFPGVDPDRIGAFGICGGAGYVLEAAKRDRRIRAVATLSMFNTGEVRREGFMKTAAGSADERLREAAAARAVEAAGGEAPLTGAVDFDRLDDDALARIPTDLYREGMRYYGITHRHPNSTFAFTTSSLADLVAWDVRDHMDLVRAPLLMMAGSKADSRYMTEEAFALATGTPDRTLRLIEGATHIRTYFVPEYVDCVIENLGGFFGRTL